MARRKEPSELIQRVVDLIIDELDSLENRAALPPETDLAERFGVARRSVRAAMEVLEAQGLVRRVRGKGTFPAKGARARGIFRSSARRIAVAGVRSGGGFYSLILEGVFEGVSRMGGELVLAGGLPESDSGEACYRLFDDRRVDGVVLVALTDQDLLADLAGRGKPVCLVDHYSERAKMDTVRVDSYGAARLAVEHLLNLGHERIAYIGPENPETNPRRLEGYRDALSGRGTTPHDGWVVSAPTTVEGGSDGTMRLLSAPEDARATGIVAFSDEMAVGAMVTVSRFGLRVPDDISIIGAGGVSQIVSVGLPELTSIRFDPHEMGRTAVRYLEERIEDTGLGPRETVVPTRLHMGQSTGRCDGA